MHLILLQWMVYIIILLTPSPGGVGGAEVAFLLVFAGVFPEGSVALIMAAWRFVVYYFMLLTGLVLLIILPSVLVDTPESEALQTQ